jgi:adenine-specific DNA-methyltransferase
MSDGKKGRWRKKPEKLDKDHIFWKESGGFLRPFEVVYYDEANLERINKLRSIFYSLVENSEGTKELIKLFNTRDYFSYPKPTKLIKLLVNQIKNTDSIILDFFSGSATTAHAVMQLNAEDGGNRKFIMVQLPEKTTEDSEAYKAGYKNICEIGKERIRRAGELVKKDLIEKNAKLDKDEEKVDPNKLDIGFKVFKLEESNFKEWDSSKEPTIEQLELFADPIKEGKSEEDVLYEVLLKYGVFDQEVKKLKINKKDVYSISDNYLIVMLSNKITPEDVEEIKKLKPKIVIFRDSGFNGNDTIKINAFYTLTKTSDEKDQVEVKSV